MKQNLLRRFISLFHLSAGDDARAVSRSRLGLALLAFFAVYAIVAGRLVMLATVPDAEIKAKVDAEAALAVRRPDIVDRHGRLLAADVVSTSLYAEPRRMIDPDEAADLVMTVFPDLDAEDLRRRFASDRGFEWVKREITPEQKAEIFRLGVPGLGFLTEKRRIYPNGPLVSHILGAVNIDNHGIAGLEKYLDTAGYMVTDASKPKPRPITLPLDLGVQHAVRDELMKSMKEFSAIAASGTVMDVETGEIVALVSLPDFDPNSAADALKPEAINRVNVGVFEMGSTFKALTVAMALDSGRIHLNDTFDARTPLQFGRFRIDDFHPTRRILSVPEVFLHSSNIGTAKMALMLGVDAHKAFLKKMGQLDRLRTEMPESSAPILPQRWGELNTVTISFGHGIAVAPIQTVMATAALVNGGKLVPPTFMSRTKQQADDMSPQVIKPSTSDAMRYLLRLNAEKGSAKKANVPGYRVGGKTGTAEKVINGRYSKEKVMNTFTAVFPTDKPRYMLLVVLDEPKGTKETFGFRTSGWNTAPTASKIIERIAPLLDVEPKMDTVNAPPVMASVSEQLR
ncbi:penicillin-binding protein [Agaricicola taiwanensis]|uniref:Penicillin-binding protein n=1 Tax=Agaricicola taiwanensis TaxID=591372 RepID=A0A8J2VUY0_9RHOB|nr:penicillin-binding protein 2 [Agaricicola taiwanensis]GGE42289.1 penicillin-binding protein [Agaricicola taiwanensis]